MLSCIRFESSIEVPGGDYGTPVQKLVYTAEKRIRVSFNHDKKVQHHILCGKLGERAWRQRKRSEIGEGDAVDPVKDLIPVCPNCHIVLYTGAEITIEELQERLKE